MHGVTVHIVSTFNNMEHVLRIPNQGDPAGTPVRKKEKVDAQYNPCLPVSAKPSKRRTPTRYRIAPTAKELVLSMLIYNIIDNHTNTNDRLTKIEN